MSWTGSQLFSFQTWHWLNWNICGYIVCTKPSAFPHVPLRLKGFQCPFFSHLKGGINFASHVALISGSVSRISSLVAWSWLESSPLRPGTLPSWRSVCHSTGAMCSWCKTLFDIWKYPTFLHCSQDKPLFLPLHCFPPCETHERI